MATFKIERKTPYRGWISFEEKGYRGSPRDSMVHNVSRVGSSATWNVAYNFGQLKEAAEAVRSFRNRYPSARTMRIVTEGEVVWHELTGPVVSEFELTVEYALKIHSAGGTEVAPVPQQTLQVPRTALITRLEERQTEEQEKRAEAQAAITKRRTDALTAVEKLSTDEVLNVFLQNYGDLDDIAEMANEAAETGRFKSKELKESPVETEIDKWLRVLNMASDTNIEVSPSDNVYNLL